MKNKKIYFLVEDFGQYRSGIENSVLLRARAFNKFASSKPYIITKNYNPFLPLHRKKMVVNGQLPDDVEILNLYNYYQETDIIKQNSSNHDNNPPRGVYIPKGYSKEDVKVNRYFREGLLEYETILLKETILRKNFFDVNGKLSSSHMVEPYDGKMYFTEKYYRTDGTLCIVKRYHLTKNGQKNELFHIQLLDRNGLCINEFKNEGEFVKYWLSEIFEEDMEIFIIVDRALFYINVLLEMKKPNYHIISVIHSSHLKVHNAQGTTALNYNYKDVFRNINRMDAIIVHTLAQKKDIESRYGKLDNIYVIPHPLEFIYEGDVEQLINSRIPYKIIYLARYSPEKMHMYLLSVFKKVLKFCPKATLDLYGFGSEKEKIIKQVKKLGLTKNVTVNDFVQRTENIFRKASLAVLPSSVEGFSLFVQESIGHGLPVVSHDIDYGPREMIENGVNGFLTEPLNQDEMARAIIKILSSPKLAKEMSEASLRKAEEFRAEKVVKKWECLFEHIVNNKVK